MKKQIIILISLIFLGCGSVWAIDIKTAKNQGLVGETQNGYVAAVKAPTNEVKALIKDVNGKRKAKFEQIAKKNNTTTEAVAKIQAETWIKKTKPGHFVKIGGKWVKK